MLIDSSFYRPSAYAVAQVVCDVPMIFVQVTLFELIVYLYVAQYHSRH